MTGPVEDEPTLGVLMFIAHRAMETRVLGALAEAGFDDVTPAQARVFERVGPRGTRLTELAEQAQVTKQTAGFLVDQLERAGYVERRPDPTDARARLVCIAPRGKKAVRAAAAVERQVEAEWAAHLGPRAFEQLGRSLRRLREITDPYA